jgi:hypothetical protein
MMAVDAADGAAGPPPASAPPQRRRRRHRRSSRALRRQFSAHKLQRAIFLGLVLLLSLGVAFWIAHRDLGASIEHVQ